MKKTLPVDISDLGLTPREIKFVCEYITNGYNAELAAKNSGLLEKDAGPAASRIYCAKLLQSNKIKAAITRSQGSFVEPYRDIHYQKIQEQLEVRAFYDIADYRNADGSFKPLDQIPAKLRYAIDDMKERWYMGKNGNELAIEYTMADRDKARAELRALHEKKEEVKDASSTKTRDEIIGMLTAFKLGQTSRKQIEEQEVEMVKPISAADLAKKIKEGEYAVQEKK